MIVGRQHNKPGEYKKLEYKATDPINTTSKALLQLSVGGVLTLGGIGGNDLL